MRIDRSGRQRPSARGYLIRVIFMLSGLAIAVLLMTNPHWISSPIDAFSRLGGFMAPHGMTRLMGTYGSGLMHTEIATDGDVIVVDKINIHRYADGDPEASSVVYDMQTARDQMRDVKLGSLSVATVAADGTIYTGSWRGLILRGDGTSWSVVINPKRDADGKSIPGEYPAAQVKAIYPVGDDLLILSKGLWIVRPDGTATAVSGLDGTKLYTNAMAALPDGGYVVGTSRGIFSVGAPLPHPGLRLELPDVESSTTTHSWNSEQIDAFQQAGNVKGIAVYGESIIVVTSRAVTTYTMDGTEQSTVGVGEALGSISISPSGDWLVICRKTGLYIYADDSWQVVEFAEGLHDARVDRNGRLWATIYSQACLVGDFARVLEDATPLSAPTAE